MFRFRLHGFGYTHLRKINIRKIVRFTTRKSVRLYTIFGRAQGKIVQFTMRKSVSLYMITLQTANPSWESVTPKTRRPQQGRQPGKERENYIMKKTTIKNLVKIIKINKIQNHLITESERLWPIHMQ